MGPSTFNKDGTKGDKTKNGKPDKVARPGKDLLENDGIIFHSASIKPNAFRPKCVYDGERREEGEEGNGMGKGEAEKEREDQRAFRILSPSFSSKKQ